jgi:hypothetical protein
LAAALQLVQDLLTDLTPRPTLGGVGPICSEAFFENFPVPIGYRNLFRTSCDPVPERLDILELLVRREVVEFRRDGKSSRHDLDPWSSV